mmetsp:Transcript_54391/g.156400  ORF Transcript_54391/g.156400 Transcript_54391/m.156400 type:complete len:265 (+) Transcript_54391:58-852(+)
MLKRGLEDAGAFMGGLAMQMPLEGDPVLKVPRMGGTRDGDWACSACGNVNFADRAVCNMRRCGASRQSELHLQPVLQDRFRQDWQCTQCGNVNFGDRLTCNMRKCGAAREVVGISSNQQVAVAWSQRPSATQGFAQTNHMQPMQHVRLPTGGLLLPPSAAVSNAAGPQTSAIGISSGIEAARGLVKGDWVCSCGNLNFRNRAFCNMRRCELPRVLDQWLCQACNNTNFADRAVCNMRKCQAPRPDITPQVLEELLCKGRGKRRT